MMRASQEQNICRRQLELRRMNEIGVWGLIRNPDSVLTKWSRQSGRYRKLHALGCQKARCGLCKRHKYPIRNNGKQSQQVRREIHEQVDPQHL